MDQRTPLLAFIRDFREAIIVEFASFARTLMPAGADMSEAELRDHAAEILAAVAQDMETIQSDEEQSLKSRGHGSLHVMRASGALHADDRIRHGFPFLAVLAEFRALRATVLRLYEQSGAEDLAGVRRFNEAVDEALTESMGRFAAQADRFRDQFIGVLGHDLRSPLSAITTGVAVLAVAGDDEAYRARIVPLIKNSALRMERMIGDLLDLTRTRMGGSIPLKRQSVDLGDLCREAVLEIGTALPDVAVRVSTTGDVRGEWDPDRLMQVVLNLVRNAIQYGDGGPIEVSAQDAGDMVTLTVNNQGQPMPPELLPSIFEPLARGDDQATTGGIGLGLFIARSIVMAHAGTIGVTSSAHEGTTFTVQIPREHLAVEHT